MNKSYNIQNTNICNGIFHISFFKALLINEVETTRGEKESGRNDSRGERDSRRNDPDSKQQSTSKRSRSAKTYYPYSQSACHVPSAILRALQSNNNLQQYSLNMNKYRTLDLSHCSSPRNNPPSSHQNITGYALIHYILDIIILRVSFCNDIWYCNILAYYLDNQTLSIIMILMWSCPGDMPGRVICLRPG